MMGRKREYCNAEAVPSDCEAVVQCVVVPAQTGQLVKRMDCEHLLWDNDQTLVKGLDGFGLADWIAPTGYRAFVLEEHVSLAFEIGTATLAHASNPRDA